MTANTQFAYIEALLRRPGLQFKYSFFINFCSKRQNLIKNFAAARLSVCPCAAVERGGGLRGGGASTRFRGGVVCCGGALTHSLRLQ